VLVNQALFFIREIGTTYASTYGKTTRTILSILLMHSGGGMNMVNGASVGKRVSQNIGTIVMCTMLLSYALLGIGFFGCLMIVAAAGICF